MGPIIWMDAPLALFGVAALMLATLAGGRRRPGRRFRLGAAGASLAFLAGLASLIVVAADVGLEGWEMVSRPVAHNSPEDYAASGRPMRLFRPMPVGSLAPDFTLPRLHGGPPVRLSAFRGHKPVVLMLSSFS